MKDYQKKTLAKLSEFLSKSRYASLSDTFLQVREAPGYSAQYKALAKLEDVPYICLRLPTGGGKTLLSAHSIQVAANSYLEMDYPLVLWLVPTDTIRSQTLETLNNPWHPNREVLDHHFGGQVRIFDITDFNLLRAQDIGQSTCIFVATFASFRVNSTAGRKVYAHNENLEPHFGSIPKAAYLEHSEQGEVKYSFANLLAHYRPLVIVDEAHNNNSALSIEVLQRLRPSAIIEFTATPASNSNVLYKVSASELKAEDMIKLPIRLAEHRSWEDAVTNAIQTRERLQQLANGEDQYIRPIVLFQAENRDKDVTVDVILNQLVDQEGIPREEIAVATGDQRELDGINLFDPKCPVKYIITIQALKEGWDCSFAYVFCSMAKVQSAKDAEQLLGRILRMPYAKRRKQNDLNRAYAHLSVSAWFEALARIHDNLVSMGFEEQEASSSIIYQPELDIEQGTPDLIQEDLVVYTASAPELSTLSMAIQMDAKMENTDDGQYKVTFVINSREDLKELEDNAAKIFDKVEDRQQLIIQVARKRGHSRPLSPAEKGETLIVPQLCLDFGDGYHSVAERETFLPQGWDLLSFPVGLESFQVLEEGHVYEIDIEGAKLRERALDLQETLNFGVATHWTEAQLIGWLDRKLQQSDIAYSTLIEFLRRHIRYLQEHKKVFLPDLVRLRFVLEKLLRKKIEQCRDQAYKQGIQEVLFHVPQAAYVGPQAVMVFREGLYPAKNFYQGRTIFSKHFFTSIGSMNDEEVECAKVLDSNKKIKTWVRNIERHQESSFWLPTHDDRFYPDFVAELIDGRILVVEYKGEHLATNEDTQEKDLIGRLWADRSNSQCLFLMVTMFDEEGRDIHGQISKVLG
ncbi:MAG TPA: DEAD/DEAH box helicase family protein [Syntrophomonadaceae bacterium]|nr:DEAD/DEAH box helicase family protein [Syntrophomonadaceae bacterium]